MPTFENTWKPDDLLKCVAVVGAVVAFVIGLVQYRKAQQWKRAEWVAQEMKALFGQPLVQAALLMIDWGARRIPLHPDRAAEADRYVHLEDADVARALELHDRRKERFTDQEASIRAAFDQFLDGIERFHSYVETGLVHDSDLRPYLKYWADGICSNAAAGGRTRLERLREYMPKYGYAGALALLKRIAAA